MLQRRAFLAGGLAAAALASTSRLTALAAPGDAAGLADPTWTSFRSHNFPDRHIRHTDYMLRIDPISTASPAADRQDATFRTGY